MVATHLYPLLLLFLSTSLLLPQATTSQDPESEASRRPTKVLSLRTSTSTGSGYGYSAASSGAASGTTSKRSQWNRPPYSKNNILQYWGGQLYVKPIAVHFIYYGTWQRGATSTSGQKVLRNFLASLSAAQPSGPGTVQAWWKMNSLYSQTDGKQVSSKIYLASETYDYYSRGKILTNDSPDIFAIVSRQFNAGKLKPSSADMFVVFTSPDVRVTSNLGGFCDAYCGWHDYAKYIAPGQPKTAGVGISYAFVGNPATQCLSTCAAIGIKTPNAILGVDAMVSILAHELTEMATDPDCKTGWLTSQQATGQENADICAWKFGATRTSGGVTYNMLGVNGFKFHVQTNYDPTKASCSLG